jgi:hypothetical protein
MVALRLPLDCLRAPKDGDNLIDAVAGKSKISRHLLSTDNTIFVACEFCFRGAKCNDIVGSKTITPNRADVFDVVRGKETLNKDEDEESMSRQVPKPKSRIPTLRIDHCGNLLLETSENRISEEVLKRLPAAIAMGSNTCKYRTP